MEEFVISQGGVRYNQIVGGSPETDVNKRIFAITAGEHDLLSLFRRVFGFRGIPYGVKDTSLKDRMNQVEHDGQSDVYTEREPLGGFSALGTPIFQPFRLKDIGTTRPQVIDGVEEPIRIPDFTLPNEPLVTISNTKRLIETPTAGGTQDIIEHISLNYYTLRIQGFIVNMETDDYPEDEVRRLRSFYELRRSIKVESPILSLFNINLMAFKTLSLPAVEGHQCIQGYEITGRSDKPYQLVKRLNA
jgi:hypothetical protein